jgi:hypothetical protein
MLRFGTWAALVALVACDGDPDLASGEADSGVVSADDVVPEERRLELVSARGLRLDAGDETRIEVRLVNADDRPVAGEPVAFALVGRARDASLAELAVTTDADGVASNRLMAGQMVATFRVRASAEGADDVYVDVASSDAGFGALVVDATYAGGRAVAQRMLTAQADAKCGDDPIEGDPTLTLTDADEATFQALPADTTYAVTGVATGADGTVLASSCVDGVEVEADRDVRTHVVWDDEPLRPVGTFELEADLDTTAPAASLAQSLAWAGEGLVFDVAGVASADAADAAFLLDSLDDTLRSEAYADRPDFVSLADAIAQERAMPTMLPTLEQTLQGVLDVAEAGPRVVVARMANSVEESLSRVTLAVEVTLDRDGKELPMAWRALHAHAVPVPTDAPSPTVDLGMLDADASAEAVFRAGKDSVEITEVRFVLPFGALATQSLRTMASRDAGLMRELVGAIGCNAFADWREAQDVGPNVCHGNCIQAACDRAIGRIVAATEIAWLALDTQRPRVTLHGELMLEDEDGDLDVERMGAALLWGAWEAASDDTVADLISGSATARRSGEDPAEPDSP